MMPNAPARWRTLEHTADLAIEIAAPTLPELFVVAGRGLAGLLEGREEGDGEPGRPEDGDAGARTWRELSVASADRSSLLVDWLRELLWIQSSHDLRFVDAEFDRLTDDRLAARAAFEPLPDRSVIERELKGVTYHDLSLEARPAGWYARVVFDV